LSYYTKQADVLVVAAGRPGTVTGEMVKKGAVVIDVGTNRVPDKDNPGKNRLVGDVVFDEVAEIASAITPVPGGVGPMTITMLLANTVKACKLQNNISK
ncbi:bifunctional 5,10-methylene-tetrahydrofolate dehydrogenase/5,10-methylene-tetrahydrofolate cyclohydrolase, partial [Candidatus Dependentiae bacterium]|nr:bifunctional 5,10-methylene-tetrahydrofolate dehydrogenase/5,10-methylene-tetrahydrofolate cyclohydrolase [Candidatus Dependentiae bacterium]